MLVAHCWAANCRSQLAAAKLACAPRVPRRAAKAHVSASRCGTEGRHVCAVSLRRHRAPRRAAGARVWPSRGATQAPWLRLLRAAQGRGGGVGSGFQPDRAHKPEIWRGECGRRISTAPWCNGSTLVSKSSCRGSIPRGAPLSKCAGLRCAIGGFVREVPVVNLPG